MIRLQLSAIEQSGLNIADGIFIDKVRFWNEAESKTDQVDALLDTAAPITQLSSDVIVSLELEKTKQAVVWRDARGRQRAIMAYPVVLEIQGKVYPKTYAMRSPDTYCRLGRDFLIDARLIVDWSRERGLIRDRE